MRLFFLYVLLICINNQTSAQSLSFDFYGTQVEVPVDDSIDFSLKAVNENAFDWTWRQIPKSKAKPIIQICQNLKDSMNLNGWAIYKLVEKIGEGMQAQGLLGQNEAAIFQTYLLVHLGYDARVACINDQYLFVACPSEERFASLLFLGHKGIKYYVLGENIPRENARGRIFPLNVKELENAKPLDLANSALIKFGGPYMPTRMYRSRVDKTLYVNIKVNKGMMDFYADMPQMIDLDFYIREPLNPEVEKQLMPKLKRVIGKSDEVKAVNMLLHFMHTAYKYKTDEENFGFEKTYLKEESFFYPSSDCEDRSILFAYLVEKLLGLKTVILEYPGHVNIGVKFSKSVPGDYIVVDDEEYVLCDPSYLNSEVGQANPDYLGVKAYVYKMGETSYPAIHNQSK